MTGTLTRKLSSAVANMTDNLRKTYSLVAIILFIVLIPGSVSYSRELSGSVGIQSRYFFQEPFSTDQNDYDISLGMKFLYYHQWKSDNYFFFESFLRLDQNDSKRTHADVRELYWQKVAYSWELIVGFKKVYWGVTESQHLVDVINQTDMVESPDFEEKLGQPMVMFSLIKDWGVLDLIAMPFFREKTFSGKDGRLGGLLNINTENTQYQSSAKWHHFDWAARWSHTIGDVDIGLSHFSGTSREPMIIQNLSDNGQFFEFVPKYIQMNRTSIDLQAIKGDWLFKLEALAQKNKSYTFPLYYSFPPAIGTVQEKNHTAIVAGFEKTVIGVFESIVDVGLLMEFHYDSRQTLGAPIFQRDFFAGMRIALNDVQSSEILGGAIIDGKYKTKALFVEASKRVGSSYTLEIEYRGIVDAPTNDPLYIFSQDDYFLLELKKFF